MELYRCTAVQLAQLLTRRETSSVEIVQALHHRADEVEPFIHAYAHQFREQALEEARRADEARGKGEAQGSLHGLPLTIKENIDTAGVPTTLGLRGWAHRVPERDAVVVQVARASGAIVLGKTNVPQTLLCTTETTNPLYGTTHNPWKLGYGPGGSSGGEAAAIAAGESCFGIGTDLGGSIRIPASFCGVCGLKPTGHRWSNVGSQGVMAGQELVVAQTGPMARTTKDVALLFRGLDVARQAREDPRVPPLVQQNLLRTDVSGLRIGIYDDDGFLTPAAACRRAVQEAGRALEEQGAEVVAFVPQDVEDVLTVYLRGLSSDGTERLQRALDREPLIAPLRTLGHMARLPTRIRNTLAAALRLKGDARTALLLDALGEKRVHEYWQLASRRVELRVRELERWNRLCIDALLTPAYATNAPPFGAAYDFTLGFNNLARYNLLDFPAGVVPVTRVEEHELRREPGASRVDRRAAQIQRAGLGLPIGVQIVGRPWQEDRVLAVMEAVERGVRGAPMFPATPVSPQA